MTKKRLFLELLENKKKVNSDKLYEFHSSPEDEEDNVVVKSDFDEEAIESAPAESLLQDLLQSEDLNLNNLNLAQPTLPIKQDHSPRRVRISPSRSPPKRSPPRRSPPKRSPPRRSPPKRSPPRRLASQPAKRQSPALRRSPPSPAPRRSPQSEPPRGLNDEFKKTEIAIKKQELLIKFDILRKNSQRHIPMYTMNHNYSVMKHHYKLLVKQLHIDNKITFYKQCLLGVSGYLEIFLGEAFMGLDMKGYTEFQANNINQYDKILLKIGEKSYMPQTISSLSVEMQLLVTMGIQTAIFVGSKMIANKTGLNVAQLFKQNVDVNLDMPKS